MRNRGSNLDKLVRLQEEFDAETRSTFNHDGRRNRASLLRLSELASQMVRLYEAEATEMSRLANQAYDLAMAK